MYRLRYGWLDKSMHLNAITILRRWRASSNELFWDLSLWFLLVWTLFLLYFRFSIFLNLIFNNKQKFYSWDKSMEFIQFTWILLGGSYVFVNFFFEALVWKYSGWSKTWRIVYILILEAKTGESRTADAQNLNCVLIKHFAP